MNSTSDNTSKGFKNSVNQRAKLWVYTILIAIIFIICVILAFLWNANQKTVQKARDNLGQLTLVGEMPVIIKDGNIYEYTADELWNKIEYTGEAKQIVRGEELCVLNKDGSLYYEKDIVLSSEVLPLTSAYHLYIETKVLELNKEEPFVCINQNLDLVNFRALLQSGDIIYQASDKYERYQMAEETPVFLSGSYILTAEGNVYYLHTDTDGSSGIVKVNLKCEYDCGDIVAISASETAARCLLLRKNGKVISLSDIEPLKVSNWENLVSIEQGFNYAVGLTDKGEVLYVDYNTNSTEAVAKKLKTWTDVIQIASYSDTIVGRKNDGSCYILNLSDFK